MHLNYMASEMHMNSDSDRAAEAIFVQSYGNNEVVDNIRYWEKSYKFKVRKQK